MRLHLELGLRLKQKGSRPMTFGAKLFLALSLLSSLSCRTTSPPPIDVCLGDGFGGADCKLRTGSRLRDECSLVQEDKYYCAPSHLQNMWMTTQEDMANWASWAYDAPQSAVQAEMKAMKIRATAP